MGRRTLRALHPNFDMTALRRLPFRGATTWEHFTVSLRKSGLDIPDDPTEAD